MTQLQEHESDEDVRQYPVGVRHIARWVRLCERQGTRMVDLIERWVEAAEEHNRLVNRLADTADRIASHADAYIGFDEEGEE